MLAPTSISAKEGEIFIYLQDNELFIQTMSLFSLSLCAYFGSGEQRRQLAYYFILVT